MCPFAHRGVERILDRLPAAAGLDVTLVARRVDVRKGLANEVRNTFQDWPHRAIKVGHDRLAIHDVRLVFLALDKTVQRAAGSRSVHREF